MTLRERRDEQFQDPQHADLTTDAGDDTQELRDEGEAFLAAADEAINRALSRDSIEFLAQNRQLGGQ